MPINYCHCSVTHFGFAEEGADTSLDPLFDVVNSELTLVSLLQIPGLQALPPPIVYTETAIEIATETKTVTQIQHHTQTLPTKTVTVPQPANTRHVASPAPERKTAIPTSFIPRTTAVEVVVEDVDLPSPIAVEEEDITPPVKRRRQPKRGWFGGW